jgi:MoaA/NifB/PqqE/SkfB family radical SAM enzyme
METIQISADPNLAAEAVLPRPAPDTKAYLAKLGRGFADFPERRANWELYQSRTAREEVGYLPIKMDYEVASRCNFKCVMCPVGTWPGGKRAEDTTYEQFETSLLEQSGLVEIKLQGAGEPMLNKDYFRMIELAHSRHIWIRTITNGSLLRVNGNHRRIVDAGADEIQVSFDGSCAEVFQSIRRGSNFEQVCRGVREMHEHCARLGVLRTRAWCVVQRMNVHDLEEIVRTCSELGFPRVTFSLEADNWGLTEWESRMEETIRLEEPLVNERLLSMVDLGKSLGIEVTYWQSTDKYELKPGRLCEWPFERAFISSEMRIAPCCTVSNPDTYELGKALPFPSAWNSPEYQEFRRMHLEHRIPDVCKGCYKEYQR